MIDTFFAEKKIIKKIIIAIVFVFMFNFTFSYLGNNVVFATTITESNNSELAAGGGRLLLPIQNLILFLTDSVLSLLQNSFLISEPITLKASSEDLSNTQGLGIMIGGIVITAIVIASFFTPIPGDEAASVTIASKFWTWAISKGITTTIAAGAITVAGPIMAISGNSTLYKNLKGEFKLPNIFMTPSAIFGNTIPMFNINFFNPSDDIIEETITENLAIIYILKDANYSDMKKNGYVYSNSVYQTLKDNGDEEFNKAREQYKYSQSDIVKVTGEANTEFINIGLTFNDYKYDLWKTPDNKVYLSETNYSVIMGSGIYYNYYISDVTDKVELITETEIKDEIDKNTVYYKSTSLLLAPTVSSIYKALRTVAIVAMLTILVYVGIRMVLSSASKDKAKYKQMLIDWLVAFIMLFVLHYIMAFIIDICENLTDLCRNNDVDGCFIEIPENTKIYDEANGQWLEYFKDGDIKGKYPTNAVGVLRYDAGLIKYNGFAIAGTAATIAYVVMVIYICVFSFQYMRRVIYMAFLTMIAPLVAITYPLDKINDGKAQGFNIWLKEYIFNALLQPIHYIIYVIVMGSVMELVLEHPVYALVVLGFMVPIEKLVRKMFGFEKAGTVGAFGGAAGAAMLMGGIQRLTHRSHGKKGNNDNGAKGTDSKNFGRVKSIDGYPDGSGNNDDPDQLSISDELLGGTKNGNTDGITNGNTDGTTNGNTDGTTNGNTDGTTDKKKSPFINGLKAVGGHYRRRIGNAVRRGKPLRALRRGLTYGAGAATLGTIGLAAGIASGDPSKALQYTTTGAMVGGSLGRNLGDTASNFIGLEGASNAFGAGYLGEEYAANERAKYNRDFKMNVSNYDAAVSKVTPDGWAEMSQEGGIIDASLEYGINDIGTMCNIYKTSEELRKNGYGDRSQEYAFKAYKLSKDFGDISKNKKTDENLKYILQQKGNMGAYNEIRDLIKTYNNIALD